MNKIKSLAIANLALGSTMPLDNILKAYFSNDQDAILKGIAMQVKDPKKMFEVIEQANYEIENDVVPATKSNFGKIQKDLVEQVLTQDNLTFIETNIVDNAATIAETKDCPEISAAKDVVVLMKQSNLGFSKVA